MVILKVEDEEPETIKETDENIANNTLKIDARSLARYSPKENGHLDFISQKTQDFLAIQNRLSQLDHNSMKSKTA